MDGVYLTLVIFRIGSLATLEKSSSSGRKKKKERLKGPESGFAFVDETFEPKNGAYLPLACIQKRLDPCFFTKDTLTL